MSQSQKDLRMGDLLEALVHSEESERDIPGLLEHIAETARTYLHADTCVICARNPATDEVMEPLIATQEAKDKWQRVCDELLCTEPLLQRMLASGVDLVNLAQFSAQPGMVAIRELGARPIVMLSLYNRQTRKPFGLLYLIYQQKQTLSDADREFLQNFADQVSSLLQSAWLQHRYREVARIGQEINDDLSSDVATLFRKLKDYIGPILNANHALLLTVLQPETKTLEVYYAQQGQEIFNFAWPFEGASKYVIEQNTPLFIHQKSKEQLPFQIGSLEGTRSEECFIYVPLSLRGEPIGALSIQHPEPDAYTEDDRFILELLANHLAQAIRNVRLFKNLTLLSESGQLLTQQFESPGALQVIVENIKETTRADLIVLYPYNQTTGNLVAPPYIAGTLNAPDTHAIMLPTRSDDIAWLMLQEKEAIFARESIQLYTELRGNIRLVERQRFYQREGLSSTAAIPLFVEDKSVGVLFVNFRLPQRFDATQRLLIEGLAHAAAIAVKNTQSFERLSERRIHELETLQKIDNALNQPEPDLSSVLETILKVGHAEIAADHSAIVILFSDLEQVFTFDTSLQTDEPIFTKSATPPTTENGLIAWAINHREVVRVDNVHHQPWKDIYIQAHEQTLSELDVPILDSDQVIGAINFESARGAAFREEDVQFLKTLAGQAVLAIKKAQAYEREKRSAERFRLLYEAGEKLAKLSEREDELRAYQITLDLAQELSRAPVVVLRRYDEATQELTLVLATKYRHTPPSQVLRLDNSFNGWVARNQKPLVADDIHNYTEFSHRPADPTIRSLLITPIKVLDHYYGNLELSSDIVGHFRDNDKEFFAGLAQQLANTLYRLEITQKRQEAEIMSLVGQSTFEITHRLDQDLGLIGHKIQQINRELEQHQIGGSPVTEKLDYIANAVTNVLKLGENLKSELKSGWGNEPAISLPPKVLLEDALHAVALPDTVDVLMEIEPHLGLVRVRQRLIVDALRDLVTNAKDAMPHGGILTLRAFTQGRSVAIEVKDTGMGIPQEKHSKIFELFYSTKQRSSGFGLWSALFNAKRHGGNLIVSSEEGKGATFTLLLPRSEGYNV